LDFQDVELVVIMTSCSW